MKILIAGASGMLAQAVREKFAADSNNEIILTDLSGRKVGEAGADGTVKKAGGVSKEDVTSNGNTEVDSFFLDITDPEVIKMCSTKFSRNS